MIKCLYYREEGYITSELYLFISGTVFTPQNLVAVLLVTINRYSTIYCNRTQGLVPVQD